MMLHDAVVFPEHLPNLQVLALYRSLHAFNIGILRDPEAHQSAVEKVRRAVEEHGGSAIEVVDSPILGAEGNREFLLHARFGSATGS